MDAIEKTELYETVIAIMQDVLIPWGEKKERIQAIAHATNDAQIRLALCDMVMNDN